MALYFNGKELNKNIITPAMLSYTQPSPFIVSASSEDRTGRRAYFAFDQKEGSELSNTSWLTDYLSTEGEMWIQIKLNFPRICSRYIVRSRGYVNTMPVLSVSPVQWMLKGSNDGVNFIDLDFQTGINFTEYYQPKEFLFNNSNPYLYYRLGDLVSGSTLERQVGIGELELYGDSSLYFNGDEINQAYFNGKLIHGN
jgi:hypothetical protein